MKLWLRTVGMLLFVAAIPALAQARQIVYPEWGSSYQFGFAQSRKSLVTLLDSVKGTFWRNPATVTSLGLTSDQQQKMDEIFRQHRINLIDLNAAVEKEELILEPLIEALPAGDQAKILSQIDRVAQARAELEKANSKMMVGILQIMTPDQVNKLPVKGNRLYYVPQHWDGEEVASPGTVVAPGFWRTNAF